MNILNKTSFRTNLQIGHAIYHKTQASLGQIWNK